MVTLFLKFFEMFDALGLSVPLFYAIPYFKYRNMASPVKTFSLIGVASIIGRFVDALFKFLWDNKFLINFFGGF